MSDTGWLVIGGVVLICAVGASVAIFGAASRWALAREAERTAAATFEAAFIPENQDVLAQERELIESEIEAMLDDALVHVERLLFAAEMGEWEATA